MQDDNLGIHGGKENGGMDGGEMRRWMERIEDRGIDREG